MTVDADFSSMRPPIVKNFSALSITHYKHNIVHSNEEKLEINKSNADVVSDYLGAK